MADISNHGAGVFTFSKYRHDVNPAPARNSTRGVGRQVAVGVKHPRSIVARLPPSGATRTDGTQPKL
jgi:hypothetical protein